jgi:predicted nucleotidyltransferase component of viral defense system
MITPQYLKDALKFSDYQVHRTMLMNTIAGEISHNEKSGLVLKGGTALLFCYGLQRFSTDLDYDSVKLDVDILANIKTGAEKYGVHVSQTGTKKDTDTVKRYMLHYDEAPMQPLKIEISYRNMDFLNANKDIFKKVNDLTVYTIDYLSLYKIDAFLDRNVARDIYDVAFLLSRYPKTISPVQLEKIQDKFKRLGLNYMEKMMKDDPIIGVHDCAGILLQFEHTLNTRLHTSPRTVRHPPQKTQYDSRGY